MEVLIIVAVVFGVGFVIGILLPSPFTLVGGRKLKKDNRLLREHLHVKMEVEAIGLMELKKENARLLQMVNNLQNTVQALQLKPDRAATLELQRANRAIQILLAKYPNFAPNWQKIMAQAEREILEVEQGLRGLFQRIRIRTPRASISLPSGHSPSPAQLPDDVV